MLHFLKISRVHFRYESAGASGSHISQVCLIKGAGNESPASPLIEPEWVRLWTKACVVGLWDRKSLVVSTIGNDERLINRTVPPTLEKEP